LDTELQSWHPERFENRVRLAVVLGSGLSGLERLVEPVCVSPYSAVPGLARPLISGHPGRLVLGRLGGETVLFCAGRHHMYEGYDLSEAGAVVTTAAALGCCAILLTQAAGGLHRRIPTDAWLIPSDIVYLPAGSMRKEGDRGGASIARGIGIPGSGESIISTDLCSTVERAVHRAGIVPFRGVLFWTSGPAYETAAEARAALALGADAANMSCLPELLAARRSGVRAACLSRITNHTANCSAHRTDHEGIVRRAREAVASLARIVVELARHVG
jgi:purine-nucleoside phosphorylase